MKIVGCDLHARQQTIAIVDTETGEFTEKTLCHEGNAVRAFYAGLEGPVVVGIDLNACYQRGMKDELKACRCFAIRIYCFSRDFFSLRHPLPRLPSRPALADLTAE